MRTGGLRCARQVPGRPRSVAPSTRGGPLKMTPVTGRNPSPSEIHRLLGYVADLELEVDRLRKQGRFIHHEVGEGLKRLLRLCADTAAGTEAVAAVRELAAALRELDDPPGY